MNRYDSVEEAIASAEMIADELSAFLDYTSRMPDTDEYFDEYDLDAMATAMEALYNYADVNL